MQRMEPCKIELRWPACCPRCGLDLRVSPEISPTVNPMEPVPPATIVLEEVAERLVPQDTSQEQETSVEEQIDLVVDPQPQLSPQTANPTILHLKGRIEIAANGEAKFVPSCAVDVLPEKNVHLWPPLPAEELKQETPPPPPSAPELDVVVSNQEPTMTMTMTAAQGQPLLQPRIDQYYGLLPAPTQVTFTAQGQPPMPNPIQFGQITLNPPPPIIVSHQQAQPQPAWTSQPSPQQPFYPTATWYRQPPPPQAVIVQQQQQQPPPQRYVQFQTPPPVNFPFPPPTMQLQPGQVPANGVFTVQHHFLNVLPPGQFQQ